MHPDDEPTPITPGWTAPRFVDLPGYDDDTVAGVLLSAPTTTATGERIVAAHPQWPNQRYHLRVCEGLDEHGRTVRFAYGETNPTAFVYCLPT